MAGIGQAISVYDMAARSTLVQQYSFDVQRQVASGVVVSLGYVGSKSTHLVQGPDQVTFGNVSHTIGMRGSGQVNWDVSVFKTFAIGEIFKAQFRAEALNFTNKPLFYGPNTQFGTSTFGRITSQANFSRMVQLGIRFFL